jgi:hypothetical protein
MKTNKTNKNRPPRACPLCAKECSKHGGGGNECLCKAWRGQLSKRWDGRSPPTGVDNKAGNSLFTTDGRRRFGVTSGRLVGRQAQKTPATHSPSRVVCSPGLAQAKGTRKWQTHRPPPSPVGCEDEAYLDQSDGRGGSHLIQTCRLYFSSFNVSGRPVRLLLPQLTSVF